MDRALANLQQLAPEHPRTHYYRGLRAQLRGILVEALEHYAAAARRQFPSWPAETLRVLAASKAIDTAIGKHPPSPRPDWIAADREEYVRIACEIGHDRARLAEVRDGLRKQVRESALMDASTFTRELETAWRQCWRRWCDANPT